MVNIDSVLTSIFILVVSGLRIGMYCGQLLDVTNVKILFILPDLSCIFS